MPGALPCWRLDSLLRRAVADGLHGLILEGAFLGSKHGLSGGKGRTRVEVLGRALHLLLTEKPQCERARLMFSMADQNRSGEIQKEELQRMLESHVRLVGAAVPWLVDRSMQSTEETTAGADHTNSIISQLKHEIESEVPAAVEEIFSELDADGNASLSAEEWTWPGAVTPSLWIFSAWRG